MALIVFKLTFLSRISKLKPHNQLKAMSCQQGYQVVEVVTIIIAVESIYIYIVTNNIFFYYYYSKKNVCCVVGEDNAFLPCSNNNSFNQKPQLIVA